ncbi:MAG: phosphoribosylanthranilate isomerase [bacterium]|nr:phosphoribosylanthranilate isomerase [bacterium]
MTRIKICCISSIEEARLAVRLGASALGFVTEMPSGPGVIPEHLIAEIVATVPKSIDTFLLTSRTDAESIIAQQQRCGVNTVQLCDRLPAQCYDELRSALPWVGLVQVVHVNGEESVEEALGAAGRVDALLLDSGNQSLPVMELGGTGRTHDWELSARIVEVSPVPVFLAGGLTPDNVGDAIRRVRPHGVDLCTGVRTADALDERKLRRFVEIVGAGC